MKKRRNLTRFKRPMEHVLSKYLFRKWTKYLNKNYNFKID